MPATRSSIDYDDSNLSLFIDRFNTGRWATQGEFNAVKAQTPYNPAPEQCDLTPELVKRHLDGEITLASYTISKDNTCKFLIIDFDIDSVVAKSALVNPADSKAKSNKENALNKLKDTVLAALNGLSAHLRIAKEQYLIESSGSKGYHIWMFFEKPLPSVKVYQMANVIKKELNLYDFEIFPKQSQISYNSLGNCTKIPLGINKKTGNRCFFLGTDFNNDTRGQWQALAETQLITEEQVDDILKLTNTVANKVESGGCGHEATKSYGGNLERMISRCKALQAAKEIVENADAEDGRINLSNAWRVCIANLFMQFENGRAEVHKWLRNCENYNDQNTDRQLDGLDGQNAMTCEKMISQGLCSGRCEEIERAGGFSPFKLAFGGRTKDDKLHILSNLAQIENPIFCGKRVRVEFQVSSLVGTPYLSMRGITYDECTDGTCSKYDKCDCQVKNCKKVIDIPTSDKTHVEVFGLDDSRTGNLIKGRFVRGCSNVKALYPASEPSMTLVQPFLCSNVVNTLAEDEAEKKFKAEDCTKEALAAAKEYKDYMAFFTGNTLETSKTYLGEGTVMANPKNQILTILFDKAEPMNGQIEGFNLKSDPELENCFQDWKNLNMQEKIDDFRNNICMIYGRDEVILAMMLVIFSPLELMFNCAHQKGWLEAIFIGDSGQAKSKVVERITTYAGVGAIVGQNCSVAGLIGGNEQQKEQRYISWGLLPRNNKGLVFLDEFQEFNVNVISALRTVRSTGVASISKMKGGQHEAKCRLVCAANPKDKKNMAEYRFGAEALTEIMNPADIRRFDLACFLAEEDIKQDVINIRANSQTPRISRKTFQTAILWAWSRKEEDIIISDEVTDEILAAASRISQEFNTDTVPLCNTADMREKIARMVCAMAAFLGKTPDNEKVVPEIADVRAVEMFLQDIYSKQTVGLDKLAAKRRKETSVDDDQIEMVVNLINNSNPEKKKRYEHVIYAMQMLQRSDHRSSDIANMAHASDMQMAHTMSLLTELNLVTMTTGGIYKSTPKMAKMLRLLEGRLADSRAVITPDDGNTEVIPI